MPCWDRDCPGTILVEAEPTRSRCSVCRRPLPGAEAVKKTMATVVVIGVLVVVIGVAWVCWLVWLMHRT